MQASATLGVGPSPVIGQARLIRAAFEGSDMAAYANEILSQFREGAVEAGAAMDVSTILLLLHRRDNALRLQAEVLQTKRYFALQSNDPDAKTRVLVIVTAGDLMANTPIDFLLNDKEFAVSYLFVLTGDEDLHHLPEHDVIVVGIAYSSANAPLLQALAEAAPHWRQPIVNHPRHVLKTSREGVAEALKGVHDIIAPSVISIERSHSACLGKIIHEVGGFPIIVRPLDTHAGSELEKIDSEEDLAAYVNRSHADNFYITKFYDYRGNDGLFRKYRIALIDGIPYICHMALRDHWMIHYLNAGMLDNPDKREAEAQAMAHFYSDFASRHRRAFDEIYQRIGLDYLTIDCSETKDGKLIVFEADTGMIVHDMDSPDMFPYKKPHMQRVFSAFQKLARSRQSHTA